MATFSQMVKGGPARHPILPFELIDGTKITGDDCAVIPLFGEAEAKVLKGAREFAIEHGLSEPKPGDPLYELGRAIWTCALGVVDGDPKVPESAPVLFFDGGVKQIREKLDRDRIFFLARQQEAWQSEVAPGDKDLKGKDYIEMLVAITQTPEGVDLPLERLPLAMQRRFVRSLATTFMTLPGMLLVASSSSQGSKETSSSSATNSDGSAERDDAEAVAKSAIEALGEETEAHAAPARDPLAGIGLGEDAEDDSGPREPAS